MVDAQLFRVGVPVLLAHRGGMALAPENTREAIDAMLVSGVTVMETDLRHTSDGVAILAHDPSLLRRYRDPRDVSDVTWEELAQMRDVDGAAPLRLVDVLAEYPGVAFNLDAKTDEVVSPMLRAVREAAALERVCVTAFSARRLARMARVTRGRVMLGMGMGDVARLLATSRKPATPAFLSAFRASSASQVPRAVQVPLTFRGIPVITERFLDTAHTLGHPVHVWVINDPCEMNRLLDLGVDGIVTDVPAVAAEVFRSRGVPPAPR